MNFDLIFLDHKGDQKKYLSSIFRKIDGPQDFFLISIALLCPLLTRRPELMRIWADRSRNGISGNPTVCDCFDDFKHELHIRQDTVQFDVFVLTVSATAAHTHCINGGNTQCGGVVAVRTAAGGR
jgi:hypothetical protein